MSIIGSYIGIPIQTDHFTNKRNKADFARLLVEVDTTQLLLREVKIHLPSSRELKQPIIYEVEPILCSKCHRLGHTYEVCKGVPKNAKARSRSKSRGPPFILNVVRDNHQTVACKENATIHREVPHTQPDTNEVNGTIPNAPIALLPILQDEAAVLSLGTAVL